MTAVPSRGPLQPHPGPSYRIQPHSQYGISYSYYPFPLMPVKDIVYYRSRVVKSTINPSQVLMRSGTANPKHTRMAGTSIGYRLPYGYIWVIYGTRWGLSRLGLEYSTTTNPWGSWVTIVYYRIGWLAGIGRLNLECDCY